MFNSVTCSSKVHCNEKDMNTLLHFKQGVIDPSGMLSSWFTEQDCCHWTGVQCDNITGRVTELNLPCHTNQSIVFVYGHEDDDKSHCLTGEFNIQSLLELEFLSYLNLSNNDFKAIQYNSIGSQNSCDNLSRGTPPHQCRNSSNLHYLDLSYNYDILIPNLHWIFRLSSLQYLNLGGLDLHKAINWLQSVAMLPSLVELHLQSCQLEDIHPSLQYANFTSLQVLDLAHNHFISELPSWLFNLSSHISHIDLSQNSIHGQLSQILPNHRSIKSLVLSDNNLDGPIPDWIGQLEQLQELDLSHNSFSGPIPTILGNLSSLIVLNFCSNNLNGNLPESLGQLFNLDTLRVGDNSLTGIVSERNLLSLSNLKHLFLSSPALIFDFDPEWVPPFQLKGIDLGYVNDKLPSWLFTQSSLKILTISDSNASFEPLDKFWNFATQLEILSLGNNTINGNMSNVLLNSTFVWLHTNNLRGGVPRLSPKVADLTLYNNSLTGSISPLLCHKMAGESSLTYLEMGKNLLSGELTDCWNDWKLLRHVGLEKNNLTGMIPHSMGSLSNLISLDLYGNKFFGEVPLSLKDCNNLWILNLGENNFSGAIPSWVGSAKVLLLSSNQFSGNIPTQICQLNSLMVMDFANNALSGPIPNCLHNITSMLSDHASFGEFGIIVQVPSYPVQLIFSITMPIKGNELLYSDLMYAIDFSSNNLSGTVPSEIFMLTRLQLMNLSHNRLVGTIPDEIGNMKPLESIDLSSNRLSGQIPQAMSGLSFLGYLNLSFNNLMGKIPSGTQLQGFTNLSYMGNNELCGPPLTQVCPQDEKPHNTTPMGEDHDDDDDKSEVYSWFYMGLGMGFASGFWGVFGLILFNRRCRHAYFRFLHRLYTTVIQKMNSLY
ncbi:receptor-like protein EIX2 [Gastrolobium bilobum]|uniref:receptor-like protein EIX2 n=1 Tax=Gastrolobium bilobum TaxID=150636 RepID=UPI002AB0DEC5|nr:receptor-like protein EIX2 [Gastrolobium bilobum]